MGRILALLTRLVSFLFGWLPFCGRRERLVGDGKRVLVSGCDSGIGLRLAQRLHEAGYRVLAGCLSTDSEGARLLSKLSDGYPVLVLQLDVTSDRRLWGLVNNAGVCVLGEFEWMTQEQVERTMAVNLLGTLRLTKSCLPYIRRSKGRVQDGRRVRSAAACGSSWPATEPTRASFVPGTWPSTRGIMKRQADDNKAMWESMDEEQRSVHGAYFWGFVRGWQSQQGALSPGQLDDSPVFDHVEHALGSRATACPLQAMSTGSASPLRNPLGTASPATPGTPGAGRPFCTLTNFGLKLVAHALQEAPGQQRVVHAVGATDSNNLYRTCEKILSMLDGAMPKTKVSLGSRLYVSDEITLLPEFKETVAETFSVGLGRMNFRDNPQAAAQEINAWAAKATDGNLTHLLRDGDVNEHTRILMVSAIYFRGVFSESFHGPVKAPFYVNSRETAQVDMMESCRGALYCRSTRIPCEAIELSYVCRSLSLLIILPDKDVALSKLVAVLNNDANSYAMVPALKAVGITHLFDDHVVDLSRMTGKSTGVAVDNFVHEALFDTSEEGVGEPTRPPDPLDASMITFRANRPFLYVLLHHYNHAVVFMGAVCRP
ncbi:hypothetical protein MTO96_028523 [Rhipicephalus appendiculatus]